MLNKSHEMQGQSLNSEEKRRKKPEAKFLNILWGLELILRIELGTESPMVQNF